MKPIGTILPPIIRLAAENGTPTSPAEPPAERQPPALVETPARPPARTVAEVSATVSRLAQPHSPALRDALTLRARDGGKMAYGPLGAGLRLEIDDWLKQAEPLLWDASPAQVAEWLLALAQLSENPPKGEALLGAIRALAPRLKLPACCFTEASLVAVARQMGKPGDEGGSNGFFPGLARLEAALIGFARTIQGQCVYLRQRRDSQPPPSTTAPDTSVDQIPESEIIARLQAYRRAPMDRLGRIGVNAFWKRLLAAAPGLEQKYRADFEELLRYPDEKPAVERPVVEDRRPLTPEQAAAIRAEIDKRRR